MDSTADKNACLSNNKEMNGSIDPQPTSATSAISKIRHDWYQTQTHVVVTILIKGVHKDDLTVDITEKTLSITVRQVDTNDYNLDLRLTHEVVPDGCSTRIYPSKVECKMKKKDGHHWPSLECHDAKSDIKQITVSDPVVDKGVSCCPGTNRGGRDWDKIVHDIKEQEKNEEPEGDEALNNLFQKIYADGSDETRKAMNKSFSESGGTVLSTNWGDIGSKKTEIKPPDGMEFKKWDQ